MKERFTLLLCIAALAALLAGCGPPGPARIRQTGLKPVNDPIYYPELTKTGMVRHRQASGPYHAVESM